MKAMFLLWLFAAGTADAFSIPTPFQNILHQGGGGRAPDLPNKVDSTETWEASGCEPSEARLIVLQITDVYTLENFAHFKTLVEETRAKSQGAKVVCMLTGDFLSPYLLSGVDDGAGMMNALNKVPMDYISWGNHEADIDHAKVCEYVRDFKGTWLNSNMLDHETMEYQDEYDVVEIESPDGSQTRKVGLCAVLSDDPALYSHFQEPGAFGGATISCPWEALTKYNTVLKNEEGCDMVLPLQHMYVPDDHKTCKEFDFPVILSGHDHHQVDEVVDGTRLIKPGMNADYATVLEISWKDGTAEKPKIRSRFVKCQDWEADPVLAEENERAYDVLDPLRNTELARVPPSFEPLTSNGSRESVCTMGRFLCSLIKTSLNGSRNHRRYQVDAVMLMGGNIRGNADYELGSFFSLEALEAEIKSDEVVGTVLMPGWLLAKGIEETHAGDPIPGWFQFDDGILKDDERNKVTHVAGEPLEPSKMYRVATKISDLTNGQSPALTEYYEKYPHYLPPKGTYANIHAELMGFFSRNLWRKLQEAISRESDEECGLDSDCQAEEVLQALDTSGDGAVSVEEIQVALNEKLGYSIDERETTLAEVIHEYADQTGDGCVTKEDFEVLCEEPTSPFASGAHIETHDDKLDTTVEIRLDGKQRNFLRERTAETEDPVPTLQDIPQMVATALLGKGSDYFQP